MPTHLRPTAPIAPDLLLPSDPALALTLAQALLERPLMANHSHGLWGYSGTTALGRELTIQATGIGGPSAAAVLAELSSLGARRAIRVGIAVGLDPGLGPGDALVVERALAADGAANALGARAPSADPELTRALAVAVCRAPATVGSLDLWQDTGAVDARWRAQGAVAADLETAAVLALGASRGLAVGCALAIAEAVDGGADEPATERTLIALGRCAATALADRAQEPAGGR